MSGQNAITKLELRVRLVRVNNLFTIAVSEC